MEELEEELGGRETADDLSSVSGYESLEGGLNSTDCLLSFANPNYSGPPVAAGRREEAADRHATAAQALMAPTADTGGFGGLELREAGRPAPHNKAARPKSAFIQPSASTELQTRRPRPLSDGRLGDVPEAAYPPQLRLLMYVIGGREVGQVTVNLLLLPPPPPPTYPFFPTSSSTSSSTSSFITSLLLSSSR